VNDRTPKIIAVAAMAAGVLVLLFVATTRPEYFTSPRYLAGFLAAECLIAAVWLYKRAFFPVFIATFLLAGLTLPIASMGTIGRWLVLGVGSLVGTVIMLKERRLRFSSFHALALFSVLAAMVSAAVSRYTLQSSMKVLSLFLLFLYGATGARLAVSGRENRFFLGLLTGCEIFVAVIAALYLSGKEIMGNPNSLGAVMGVVAAPILLWGTLLKQEAFAHRRRVFFFAVAMYFTFSSQARAALLAATVSCGLLCLILRKYRLLAQGLGVILIIAAFTAIVRPDAFSKMISSTTSAVVYKGKDPGEGIMSSRESPWQDTINVIRDHFWFGTGFGTSDKGDVDRTRLSKFASTSALSAEHGSGYLAIVSWVGVLGVLPFLLLLGTLLGKVIQTFTWMFRTRDPSHAAVPLAIVVLAGLIHTGFEDWLFAPGYYLCAFFWSMAFMLVDQVPMLGQPDWRSIFVWRNRMMHPDFRAVAPNR
jgi:O-antigen ligase